MTAQVVKFGSNLSKSNDDLASNLRYLAARIEAGEFGDLRSVIVIRDGIDETYTHCYGEDLRCSTLVGVMQFAMFNLMRS